MSYKIYSEDDGKSFCIYKLNDDGSQGERVGKCENSKEEAQSRLDALETAEDSKFIAEELVEELAPDSRIKAVTMGSRSFNEFIMDVHEAWTAEYGYSGWVVEVFEKYFIAQKDKHLWKIPYTRGDEVEIADTNEWVRVKPLRGYTEKYAPFYTAIKSLTEDTIGAYGILWGDADRKDLHGEYFTKNTEELTAVFEGMGAIPFLFNHGVDGVLKSTVIGKVTEMTADDIGLWFEAKITQHEAYKKLVQPLLHQKALYPSSGVLPAAKKVSKSGQITRWPIIEMTGTHMPAEHRMLDIPMSEVNKFYKSVGLPEFEIQPEEDTGSEKERLQLIMKQQMQKTRAMEYEI